MKKRYYLTIAYFIFFSNFMCAQNNIQMAIKDYGAFKLYENPTIVPSQDSEYKVLLRVTKDIEKDGVNKDLWQVARLINLLKAYNVPNENIKIVAVVSGKAFPATFTNETYQKRYGKENPNIELINDLKKYNVTLHICGQTLADNTIDYEKEVSPLFKLTFSAMIDVIEYTKKGYVVFE